MQRGMGDIRADIREPHNKTPHCSSPGDTNLLTGSLAMVMIAKPSCLVMVMCWDMVWRTGRRQVGVRVMRPLLMVPA